MARRLAAAAWLLQVMLCGLCITAGSAHAADDEAHVLILNGVDPYLPAYLTIDSGMRASLADYTARHIVFFSEPLDAQRFSIETLKQDLVPLLANKYKTLRIDVVVAVTRPAVDFFVQHGEQLWPGSRLVYQSVPREAIESANLPPNALGVVGDSDVRGTIDVARRLQPDAHRILVVSGLSDFDVQLERKASAALLTKGESTTVEFLSGWPLSELVTRVAAEPANTIILYLTQFRDRNGRPYTPGNVQRTLSGASVAPIYSPFETHVAAGAAGGSVESFEETGRLVGEQIRLALSGGLPGPGRAVLEVPNRCVANARALQHWSLNEGRLPEGCEIRFADRNLWREYWWQILAALAVIAAQTVLIATLLAERRRSRIAEDESRKRLSETAHMNRRVALGEMSASIAHELNQPLGAIYNNAGAAEILIKADPPKLDEVAEILSDIKRDDQRASDIIGRIRTFLRKTEFELRDTDLNDTISESLKTLAGETADKEIAIETRLEPGLPKVSADRVQLQQVILNLALNGIEAMHESPAGEKVLRIRSRRASDTVAEISITDSGAGIPTVLLPRIFEPFVTSKKTGMGLGLAISRTIIEAHGGGIRAENAPDGGAEFLFTLPFAKATRT